MTTRGQLHWIRFSWQEIMEHGSKIWFSSEIDYRWPKMLGAFSIWLRIEDWGFHYEVLISGHLIHLYPRDSETFRSCPAQGNGSGRWMEVGAVQPIHQHVAAWPICSYDLGVSHWIVIGLWTNAGFSKLGAPISGNLQMSTVLRDNDHSIHSTTPESPRGLTWSCSCETRPLSGAWPQWLPSSTRNQSNQTNWKDLERNKQQKNEKEEKRQCKQGQSTSPPTQSRNQQSVRARPGS